MTDQAGARSGRLSTARLLPQAQISSSSPSRFSALPMMSCEPGLDQLNYVIGLIPLRLM